MNDLSPTHPERAAVIAAAERELVRATDDMLAGRCTVRDYDFRREYAQGTIRIANRIPSFVAAVSAAGLAGADFDTALAVARVL